MAAATKLLDRIAFGLHWLSACVDDLEDMLPEWNELPIDERISFSQDWNLAMTRDIPDLSATEAEGFLTRGEQEHFHRLLERTEARRDDLERLQLTRPREAAHTGT